jgi:hypothetical protein
VNVAATYQLYAGGVDMITLVAGLIAAIIFILEFFGVKVAEHNLLYLGLFFLALAIAFIPAWPWIRNRTT